jgi:hypothetical protein
MSRSTFGFIYNDKNYVAWVWWNNDSISLEAVAAYIFEACERWIRRLFGLCTNNEAV